MELFVPPVTLNRTSAAPLHRQIHRQIARQIRGGEVHAAARLPSTRVLAKLLRVSRNTVLTAYEELAADGLIRVRRGVGMQIDNGSSAPGSAFFGLHRLVRAANYPARVLAFADPDGNALYINHR